MDYQTMGGTQSCLQKEEVRKGYWTMIARPGFGEQDQWQVQIQAQIQLEANVYVYSKGLTDDQIEKALLKPCRNILKTVEDLIEKYGPKLPNLCYARRACYDSLCKNLSTTNQKTPYPCLVI